VFTKIVWLPANNKIQKIQEYNSMLGAVNGVNVLDVGILVGTSEAVNIL